MTTGDGFLETAYLGNGRIAPVRGTHCDGDAKTRRIIERYRGAIAPYPPDELERIGEIPQALWEALKEIGIFGLSVGEEYGGQGLSVSSYLRVVQEMARMDLALAIVPLAHLSIGIKGIQLFGTQEQKLRYLPAAASGEMIFAYALTEPLTGSDAKHIATQALLSPDGTHYVLNGTKTFITNSNYAGGLTVFAQMDPANPGHMGAFVVETAWTGVGIGKDMSKMGLTISSTASISLKDVRVPAENLLGRPGDGFRIAMSILNYGRLGLGAASVGVMEQSLHDMSRRASARKQFGSPIREFELVQEKIVEARVSGALTEAMTYSTAEKLEADPLADVAIESSHCKLFGTGQAWTVLNDALQVAGGAGYLSNLPYEKRVRDFRVATVFEGTSEIHSVYPALMLLRRISKALSGLGDARLAQGLFLLKGWLVPAGMAVGTGDRDPRMRRAASIARRAARAVRRMLYGGLILYGKRVSDREFFLRRVTTMSLGFFSITALLSKISALRGAGEASRVEALLQILDYTVERLQSGWRGSTRIGPRRIEKPHRAIMRGVDSTPVAGVVAREAAVLHRS